MKNCNICYLRDAKPCYECSACMAGDCHFRPAPKAKKQSNADRIRAMSDEELAKWLMIAGICIRDFEDCQCDGVSCRQCRLNWLQQPAEEET